MYKPEEMIIQLIDESELSEHDRCPRPVHYRALSYELRTSSCALPLSIVCSCTSPGFRSRTATSRRLMVVHSESRITESQFGEVVTRCKPLGKKIRAKKLFLKIIQLDHFSTFFGRGIHYRCPFLTILFLNSKMRGGGQNFF